MKLNEVADAREIEEIFNFNWLEILPADVMFINMLDLDAFHSVYNRLYNIYFNSDDFVEFNET